MMVSAAKCLKCGTLDVPTGSPVDTHSISEWISIARKDYTKVGVRIRTLTHSVVCTHKRVTLRAHYPAFRGSKPTINNLVDLLDTYIVGFSLPRSEIKALHDQYGVISADDYDAHRDKLKDRARELFIKANKATNRNGEAGELLLYLLTEWLLEAPQVIAKMSLKTNPNMPVYGSDGVHIRFEEKTESLEFLWGESKLHANINQAIDSAVSSLKKALSESEIDFELSLVNRNIDFTDMSAAGKKALLSYLDPMEENSNKRENIVTCFIGYNFPGYTNAEKEDADKAESSFCSEVTVSLEKAASKLASSLTTSGLVNERFEIFFFPLPSVSDLRDIFQDKIGWSI